MQNVECKPIKSLLIFVTVLLIFIGCSSSENYVLENLDTSKKVVQNYYETGQFDN